MSFILNALKKSEKERQLYENPHLHVVHGCPPSFKRNTAPNHRKTNIMIFAVMLVTVTGAGVYTFRSRIPVVDLVHVPELTIVGTEPSIRLFENEKKPVQSSSQNLEPQVERNAQMTGRNVTPLSKSSRMPVVLHNLTVKRNSSGHTIAINNEISFVRSRLKNQDKTVLPEFEDLPGSLQAVIPELHCAGHTYSTEPGKRMIIINNSILREGEKIDENLRLVEITWDGLILEFNGERFIKTL